MARLIDAVDKKYQIYGFCGWTLFMIYLCFTIPVKETMLIVKFILSFNMIGSWLRCMDLCVVSLGTIPAAAQIISEIGSLLLSMSYVLNNLFHIPGSLLELSIWLTFFLHFAMLIDVSKNEEPKKYEITVKWAKIELCVYIPGLILLIIFAFTETNTGLLNFMTDLLVISLTGISVINVFLIRKNIDADTYNFQREGFISIFGICGILAIAHILYYFRLPQTWMEAIAYVVAIITTLSKNVIINLPKSWAHE